MPLNGERDPEGTELAAVCGGLLSFTGFLAVASPDLGPVISGVVALIGATGGYLLAVSENRHGYDKQQWLMFGLSFNWILVSLILVYNGLTDIYPVVMYTLALASALAATISVAMIFNPLRKDWEAKIRAVAAS